MQEGNLEAYKKRVEIIRYEELKGMDTLWRLTFEAQNEKAREESRELLIDVHLRLRLSYDQQDEKIKIKNLFIKKAMDELN